MNKLIMYKLVLSAFIGLLIIGCDSTNTSQKTIEDSNTIKNSTLLELNKQIENNPYNPELLIKRANYYYGLSAFEKAISDMEAALAIDSLYIPALKLGSQLYFQQEEFQNSLKLVDRSIRVNESDAATFIIKAKINLFIGKHQEAINAINKSLAIDVHQEEAYFLKGYCYKEAQDTNRAISSFQTALEQNPQFIKAYMQLALLTKSQNSTLARQYYKEVIRIDPLSQEAHYGWAMIEQEEEKYEAAKKIYRGLLEIDAQNEMAYYNMGYIFLIQDSLTQAHTFFNVACRVNPSYENAYFNRGYTSERLGKYRNALKDYQQTLTLNPDHEKAQEAIDRVKAIIK